jgi:hypothetical protein
MKKIAHGAARVPPPRTLRQTASAADAELAHLESILLSVSHGFLRTVPLEIDYWKTRVRRLDSDYMLLPSQAARVASLEKAVGLLETASEAAVSGKQTAVAA